MKCLINIVLAFLMTGLLFADEKQYRGSLTLKDVQAIVLAENNDIRAAVKNINSARARYKQAFSAYLPSLSLYGSYNRNDMSIQPDHDPFIRVEDTYNEFQGGLQANWLIFDGFAREATNKAAKLDIERSELITEDMKRVLLKAATQAFYQAQLAREQMFIAGQDEEFNKKLYGDAEKRFQAGSAPESEMLNFSVRSKNANNVFLSAENNFEIALIALARLMAYPDVSLPTGMMPEENSDIIKEFSLSVEELINKALNNRADLFSFEVSLKALEQQIKIAKAAYYPEVFFTAVSEKTKRRSLYPEVDNDVHFFGMSASWNLYTGGRIKARIKELEEEYSALEENRNSKVLEIKSSIIQACKNLSLAYKTYQTQKDIALMTQKVRDHVEKGYKAGAMSLTRLNEAQTDLVRAKGALASAKIQYELNYENLIIETGEIFKK